jgi:acetoin utilization protein AcuB
LLRVLISLTGIGNGGIQFGFQVEDRPGSIKEMANIIRQFGGRMVSILTSYDDVPDGYRRVYIRMQSIEREQLKTLKDRLSRKVPLLYVIDHRQNQREIYAEKISA